MEIDTQCYACKLVLALSSRRSGFVERSLVEKNAATAGPGFNAAKTFLWLSDGCCAEDATVEASPPRSSSHACRLASGAGEGAKKPDPEGAPDGAIRAAMRDAVCSRSISGRADSGAAAAFGAGAGRACGAFTFTSEGATTAAGALACEGGSLTSSSSSPPVRSGGLMPKVLSRRRTLAACAESKPRPRIVFLPLFLLM